MKYARLALGSAAVIIGLWVIVGEQMSGASADAVVNAPVITLRSPVAGNLSLPARQIGSRVTAGEILGSVDDPLVDRVRLSDLLMEGRFAESMVERLTADLAQTRAQRAELLNRTITYRQHRLDELRSRLAHAELRLAYIEKHGLPADTDRRTLRDTLPGEPQEDFLTLDHARERVEVLRITVAAAEKDVFLGDGYNDAPNAEQRMVEVDGQIDGLTTALAEATARQSAVQERIDQERLRVNNASGKEFAAPVNGLYWEVLEANGVNVQRGDPVLRVLDCSATMVTLSVTERVYNGLSIGQAARFRLGGTSDVFEGTISRLAGSGAETVYRTLAVAPSPRHLERYDVALIVPGLQQDQGAGCRVGRTGRVFFDTRPLDWLRNLLG